MESDDRGAAGLAIAESRNPGGSWPKRARPQSLIAQEWSDRLDSLFKIDSGLDTRLHTVEEKRRSVYAQNRELEALEARIKAAEERLRQAGSESGTSTASKSHSPERASETAKSIFATMETTRIPEEVPEEQEQAAGEEARTPISRTSNEYVVVERPRAAERQESQSHEPHSDNEEDSE